MTDASRQRALLDYIAFYEHLSVRAIPLLGKHVAANVQFSDPFNTLHGGEAMAQALSALYSRFTRMHLTVRDYGWARDGNTAYIRWTFTGDNQIIDGMSEVIFSSDGQVIGHSNFWDSGHAVLAHHPLLRLIWVKIKKTLGV